jgi:hypothetical protein
MAASQPFDVYGFMNNHYFGPTTKSTRCYISSCLVVVSDIKEGFDQIG